MSSPFDIADTRFVVAILLAATSALATFRSP
jgi:hypothetical protein